MSELNREIALELYRYTKGRAFSSNELRELGLHKKFHHHNCIGTFFRGLQSQGYAIKYQHTKAEQKAANKREIGLWTWTEKAEELTVQQSTL